MISKTVIMRILEYKDALIRMNRLGVEKVSSQSLGELIGIKTELVRKDFSLLKITGNKKAKYDVINLIESIDSVFSSESIQKAIIVGFGKIGKALLMNESFKNKHITISACFDVDPDKLNIYLKPPILPLEELANFTRENSIKLGIITVPETKAQDVFDIMYFAGIRAFLNFTPANIISHNDTFITNIRIAHELQYLTYQLNNIENQE